MSGKTIRMTLKVKLHIFEFKERYPQLSPEFISDILNVNLGLVKKLINEGEIEVPSKMNDYGRTKKNIRGR